MARYELLPPLSTEEFDALKADIKANGVQVPVVVDEDGEVLDGHHRLKCDKKAPRRVIEGMTEGEKLAYVYGANNRRRNLSPAEKKALGKAMKATAELLLAEGKTQLQVGKLLGVLQQRVAEWFTSSTETGKACKPDARVKMYPDQQEAAAVRVEAGENQAQVAADYKVTQQTISAAVRKHRKKAEKLARAAEVAAVIGDDDLGIHAVDFRQQGVIGPDTMDMIFTDPPYDEASVPLYGELAKFASGVLVPGGWCLAYCGQFHLPAVLGLMAEHLEYGWTFAISHSGGDQRIHKYELRNGWKPIVGFYRPPLNVWWQAFRDLATGKREKDEHEWQQAEAEAAHYIGALCRPAGVVCDPFCGGGTTPVAASRLGRGCVAFEIEVEKAEAARSRLYDLNVQTA